MAFNKNEKAEVTQEERLSQLMKNQIDNQKDNSSMVNRSADSHIESFLMFKLICSMNEGNCGMFRDRPKMAACQLEELQKMGFDLSQIYHSIKGMYS